MPDPTPTFRKISAMMKRDYDVDISPPTLKETFIKAWKSVKSWFKTKFSRGD